MKAYDIKRGNVVEHGGRVYQVREVERSAPQGRGGNTTYRIIMYAVPGGQKLDVSLRAEDELREVDLARRPSSYSYMDGENYVFMDAEDYTQYLLGPDMLGDNAGYVSEGLTDCYVQLIEGEPVGVQLPDKVELEIVDTAPELKGATATKRPKPAKLATGLEILVPEYVKVGERVVVSTVTGEFVSRA